MEIGTMSAEEFAKSFSNQNQDNQPNKSEEAAPVVTEIGTKSSEELAKEGVVVVKPEDAGKTPEQLAEEKEVADAKTEAEKAKTKIDDSFKQGLDKLYQEKKLNLFSDGTEAGYTVPETWEDVLEVLDENKKIWVEESKAKDRDELYKEILATKSPAWQFLIENSETYKDPGELVPLLTAVQNLEYSNSLDPKVEEDQVSIIRNALSIQGLSTEDIEYEIVDLKERDALEKRAVALKPVLDKYNEAQTEKVLQAKERETQQKEVFWNTYYDNLEESIFKAKEIDGVKLKNEHKQLIASTLIPDEKLGGLPIYTIIDKLVAAGNFKALSKIALLSVDEKLFDTYFLTKKVDAKADGIQKILRQSGTSSNSTEFEQQDKPKPIKKSSYGYFG